MAVINFLLRTVGWGSMIAFFIIAAATIGGSLKFDTITKAVIIRLLIVALVCLKLGNM